MNVSKINSCTVFKADNTNKTNKQINVPKMYGDLSVGLLGASIIAGFLHKPKLHKALGVLALGSIFAHIYSLKPHKTDNTWVG